MDYKEVFVNKIEITGQSANPKSFGNGCLKFALAINQGTKDKPEPTLFLNCIIFDKNIGNSVLEKMGVKSRLVCVNGKINQNVYTNKDGVEQKTVQIIVNGITFFAKDSENKIEIEQEFFTEKPSSPAKKSEPQSVQNETTADEEDLPF